MNHSFQLRNPSEKESSIRLVLTHLGKVYRVAVGVSIPTAQWSKAKGLPVAGKVRKHLLDLNTYIDTNLDEFSTEEEVQAVIKAIKKGTWQEEEDTRAVDDDAPTFDEFFREWAERPGSTRRQNVCTYRRIISLMGSDTPWDGFTSVYYAKMVKKMNAEGMLPNYQGNLVGRLKTVLNEACKMKYIKNPEFKEWPKPHAEAYSIALSKEDIDTLWNADLPRHLARVRDLAILGTFTASRYSDYSRISEDNIKGDRLVFTQVKTQTPVTIPCSPKIRTILARNGGRAPKMVSAVYNRGLKELGKAVGFTEVMDVPEATRKKLGKKKGELVYRWELISSHTFRRTGATLLYKEGVPARVVRYLTGHKRDSTLMRYIKIDRDEAADILAQSEMFK